MKCDRLRGDESRSPAAWLETGFATGCENGIKVSNGNVESDVLVDGPHAAPKYIATLSYHLSGKTLSLNG
jgi:hypothetical protein